MAHAKGNFSDLIAADLASIYKQTYYSHADFVEHIMGFARPGRKDEWVLIGPTTVVHESPKAIKVHVEGTPLWMDEWVPRSQLHKEENELSKTGDVGMLVIPEWLAKEKGWLK